MISARSKLLYWLHEKYALLKVFLIFLILLCPLMLRIIKIFFSKRHIENKHKTDITVAFFHPNCNACRPQENVLWSGVQAIQSHYNNVQICIYTGDFDATCINDILANVESKFKIKLYPNIRFIRLRKRNLIKCFSYFGSIWVACEALQLLKPDIIIDTIGYGFVNPIFKYIGNCKVISYIQNPLITFDKLKIRQIILNNDHYALSRRSASSIGINKGIAFLYGWTGRSADIVMVNSLWTMKNINLIWKCSDRTHLIYPPIGLEQLMSETDISWNKKIDYRILNASEFKTENNHELIIHALNRLRLKIKEQIMDKVCLILLNLSIENDESYIQKLRDLVRQLNLNDFVEIYSHYISTNHLKKELIKASVGIYAKADDYFGSDIIAGLATGQIMIVHASGASKNELIKVNGKSQNGYLALNVEEYAQKLATAISLSFADKQRLQLSARKTAERFSRQSFQEEFIRIIKPFLFESQEQ